jgi:hypothetical protein
MDAPLVKKDVIKLDHVGDSASGEPHVGAQQVAPPPRPRRAIAAQTLAHFKVNAELEDG